MLLNHHRKLLNVSALLLAASSLHAAGFAIIENSASGMGSAYASGGAAAEDASTVWFNPASMTQLKGVSLVAAVNFISAKADFSNDGSAFADGSPLTGPDADGGEAAAVPTFYVSAQVTDDLFLGLSVNTPFGLGTKYDDDWVGRYHAVETYLMTLNVNPAVAYKIDEHWSVGAGVSAQYVDVKLTSAVDFGALMGAPGSADGFGDLTGDNAGDLSFGWNIGVLYRLDEHTRFSLAYRSKISHHVTGDADFIVPAAAAPLVGSGLFVDTGLRSDVNMPASASLSAFHGYGTFDLMADVMWTQWSVFKELRIKYDNPQQPDSVTTENYQDQWRVAVGGRYHVNPDLILRAGLAYDGKAVKNAHYRTPRIPDNDRTWLSLGLGYRFSEMFGCDVGYSHLFVADTPIDNQYESGADPLKHRLKGNYASSVDILSVQLSMKF